MKWQPRGSTIPQPKLLQGMHSMLACEQTVTVAACTAAEGTETGDDDLDIGIGSRRLTSSDLSEDSEDEVEHTEESFEITELESLGMDEDLDSLILAEHRRLSAVSFGKMSPRIGFGFGFVSGMFACVIFGVVVARTSSRTMMAAGV